MENLLPQNSKEINFIKIFFRILMAFLFTVIILLVLLPINDTLSFDKGEIIAQNPEFDYKAPFEVILEKVLVKEGQQVKIGDTLAIFRNPKINKDFFDSESEFSSVSKQIRSHNNNLVNIDKKIAFSKKDIDLNLNQYQINKTKAISEIESSEKSIELLKERLIVKSRKLQIDSSLYKKGVISVVELRNSYDQFLDYKKNLIETEKSKKQLILKLDELKNDYLQSENNINITITELREKKEDLIQKQSSLENKLNKGKESVSYLQQEKNKQYIVAEIDGVVTNLFNEKSHLSYIEKGSSLIKVSPVEEKFYTKAKIDERKIKYIKKGQNVNLKLDAYYYYEYGAIKGKIKYIPERKNSEKHFYVMIELPEKMRFDVKSGYTLKGDIILEEMRLMNYIIKKLFEKYEV